MESVIMQGISISINKIKVKFLYLNILPPDGRVYLVAPLKMSDDFIKSIIELKMPWIKVEQLEQNKNTEENKLIKSIYIHNPNRR